MSLVANPDESSGPVIAAPRMRLSFVSSPDLPPLAWLASIKPPYKECLVEYGRLVEARESFFVEGVWPGSFAEGDFDTCEAFFGSGAVCRPSGEIVFVPSSATVDYLYYVYSGQAFLCSNSLPFLLAARSDQLNVNNPAYHGINYSIKKGIDYYKSTIPTDQGSVERLMYNNLVFRDRTIRKEAKPLPPKFLSYDQYYDYLTSNVRAMARNAKSSDRAVPLRLISTQSSGYDTTAVNAMARDHGLDFVLSIDEAKERDLMFKPKPERERRSDSGEAITRHLGIECRLIDRRYFQTDPGSEYLYWAGLHGEDLNFHHIKEHVGNGAVLLTGVLGEIWYNAKSTSRERRRMISDQLARWDTACHGLSEVRLHVGYVHAPIPFIGARSRKSIFELTNSEAMRLWSIGGTYDRPIPRRIAEDTGVPRHLFGQTKLATVVQQSRPSLPYGQILQKEFFCFLRRTRGTLFPLRMVLTHRTNSMFWKLKRTVGRPSKMPDWIKSNPLGKRMIGQAGHLPVLGRQFNTMLYVYCVNKTVRLYQKNRTV